MRFTRLFLSFVLSALLSVPLAGQQPLPQRAPQAVAVLQASLSAMGGNVPAASVASGSVSFVEGSRTSSGTIRVLTRGVDQSSEEIQLLAEGNRRVIYSRGQAAEAQGTVLRSLPMEWTATSQCPDFPLPLLAGALSNPDEAIEYLGLEAVDGVSAHHLRLTNTFASQRGLRPVAEFTAMDVWIDAASGLPRKLSYGQREAGGSAPRIPVAVSYSDYRNVGGVLYPFSIQKSFNGTPWATITIAQVSFNVSLTDVDFPVE